MKIWVCESWIEPREVKILASDGVGTHTVVPSTAWNDPICDCKGFQFRGHCRHIDEAESAVCAFTHENDSWKECPYCGSKMVEFEVEPEFDDRPTFPNDGKNIITWTSYPPINLNVDDKLELTWMLQIT